MAGKLNVAEFPTKRKDMEVVAWENSALFNSKDFPRYNPDLLVRRQGLGIYKKMLGDEQVKAAFVFKRDAVTSRDWTLKWPADVKLAETEQKRRQALLERMLLSMRGSITDKLNHILSGMAYGYSITEKVYGTFEFEGRPESGIVDLLPRDPSTFWFYTDDYGLLLRLQQKISGREQDVPYEKFLHYVHAPEEDEWYGESDLRAAYRAWYTKDVMWKLWAIYGERMAGGFVHAEREADSPVTVGTPEYEELKRVLSTIKTVGSIITPPGIKLTIHHPPNSEAFEKMLTFADLAIAKAQLVPNLLGISHAGQTGAYAQSQTQLEAFFWTLNAIAQRLAATITEQVIKDAAYQLWTDGQCPKFAFKPASLEHVKWIVQAWKDLVGAKAVTVSPEDEEHLRKILEMPEMSAEEIEAEREKAHKRQKELIVRQPMEPVAVNAGDAQKAPVKKPATEFARRKSAEQRVAFAVIGRRTDDMTNAAVADLAALVARAVERTIEPERVAEYMAEPKLIEAVMFESPDLTKLKAAAKRALDAAWKLGSSHAINEVSMARRQPFQATFERLGSRAADFLESSGFRMAKNLTDDARKIIQQQLQNGIKFDKTAAQVRTDIYDALIRKGLTTLDAAKGASIEDIAEALEEALSVAGTQGTAAYLNTLVRTNSFEALNEARYSLFTDPQLEGFVQAMEYSAVLDQNTTELCSEMHGRVYRTDSPVWTSEGLRPPNHFNCRSTLIAITAADGWDGAEDGPPSVAPQEGFS